MIAVGFEILCQFLPGRRFEVLSLRLPLLRPRHGRSGRPGGHARHLPLLPGFMRAMHKVIKGASFDGLTLASPSLIHFFELVKGGEGGGSASIEDGGNPHSDEYEGSRRKILEGEERKLEGNFLTARRRRMGREERERGADK